MSRRELPSWTLPVSLACIAAWLLVMALALAWCLYEADGSTWPEIMEFSELETGQDRFSLHDTNLDGWRVLVDHSTGAQYVVAGEGVCPLLDADGTPLLVAEAGE